MNQSLLTLIGKTVFVIVPLTKISLSWHGPLQYFKDTNKYCVPGNPAVTFTEFDVVSIEEQQFPIIRLTN